MSAKGSYDSPLAATFKGIKDLFATKERVGTLRDSDRLDGQTILITGANSGLGFATSVALAGRGARLLMVCRSGIPEKGEEVKRLSGNDQIEMLQVDLSDFESIEALVGALKSRGEQLDQVICNAAVVPRQSRKTPQGLEEMFMVNYLSKFVLLNSLLMEGLIRMPAENSDPLSRIVIVSSESHRNPKAFEWDAFGRYKDYGMQQSVSLYGYYKLLLTSFARQLSRRLNAGPQPTVSVFSLCPGPVNSNIAREAPTFLHPLLKLIFGIFFRSPERACEPVVYLSASQDVAGKAWDYLFLMSRKPIEALAEDEANGNKLWELSEQLVARVKDQTAEG